MANYCGECGFFDTQNKETGNNNKYYCNKIGKYVSITDRSCSYFISDPGRKSGNNSGSYTPSGCSLSVIIRDILGFDDDDSILCSLREFREKVLRPCPEYLPLLIEYDYVGQTICSRIQNMDDKFHFCLELFKYFIVPCVQNIAQNNIQGAIITYQNMLEDIKAKLGIPTVIIPASYEYDPATVGKGRIKKPQFEN